MSGLEETLEQLKQAGKTDSQGWFSLDVDKARSKMERFQMVDPHHFVLSVFRSAVVSGARSFRATLEPGSCRLEYDGRCFTADELSKLESSLFIHPTEAVQLALRYLAVAINTSLAFEPRSIVLESGSARMAAEGLANVQVERVSTKVAGTRLTFNWPLSHQLRRRFSFATPELNALLERTRESGVQVSANGSSMDTQMVRANRQADLMLRSSEERVKLAFAPETTRLARSTQQPLSAYLSLPGEGLAVLVDGVFTRELPFPAQGLLSVSQVSLNVSQSDLVEDEHWQSTLRHLKEHFAELLLEMLDGHEADTEDPFQESTLSPTRLVREALWIFDEIPEALRQFPLFRFCSGSPASYQELLELAQRRGQLTFHHHQLFTPVGHSTLFTDNQTALRRLFPNATALGEQRLATATNLDWLASKERPELSVPRRLAIKNGEVGLVSGPSRLALFSRESFLGCREYIDRQTLPLDVVAAVSDRRLRPEDGWVREDKVFEEIVGRVCAALPQLIKADTPAGLVQSYLHWAGQRGLYRCDADFALTPADQPAGVAVFPQFEGPRLSLLQLADELKRNGELLFCKSQAPAGCQRPVLKMNLRRQEILASIFGARSLVHLEPPKPEAKKHEPAPPLIEPVSDEDEPEIRRQDFLIWQQVAADLEMGLPYRWGENLALVHRRATEGWERLEMQLPYPVVVLCRDPQPQDLPNLILERVRPLYNQAFQNFDGSPRQRNFFLRLLNATPDMRVKRHLIEMPLLRDLGGRPLSLKGLHGRGLGRLPYCPAALLPQLPEAVKEKFFDPVLDPDELAEIEKLDWKPQDISDDLLALARRLQPKEPWSLEAHFSQGDYSLSFESEQALLALSRQGTGRVLLLENGRRVDELEMGPLLGLVEGPFLDLEDEERRGFVLGHCAGFLQRLAGSFPHPEAADFGPARQLALRWLVERGLEPPGPSLAELALLPLANGRFLSYSRLVEGQPVYYAHSFAGLTARSILLDEPDVLKLLGLRFRLEKIQPVGSEIDQALAEELRLLAADELPQVSLAWEERGPRRPLARWQQQMLYLNRDHPLLQRLLPQLPTHPEKIYFLASAAYSMYNRESNAVEDAHERHFHQRVLKTLLGTI